MYSTSAITAIGQIPALLATFAAAAGFTVNTSNPDEPIITAVSGGKAFRFRTLIGSATQHDMILDGNGDTDITSDARARSPILAGVSQAPTRVNLIGDQTPQPYLGIVVEYGTNLYRHLYLGNMQKVGNYTGGEVISAMTGPAATSVGDIDYREPSRTFYMFGARSTLWGSANVGGVRVVHADNSVPWLLFDSPTTGSAITSGWVAGRVFGGFGDGVNDGYLARGRSPFAGVSILTPVNLFNPVPITGETSFRPLGHPAGVRLINMLDHPPGSSFDIAGETWHAYPALSRNLSTSMPPTAGSGGQWRTSESSYMVGYAYREG